MKRLRWENMRSEDLVLRAHQRVGQIRCLQYASHGAKTSSCRSLAKDKPCRVNISFLVIRLVVVKVSNY